MEWDKSFLVGIILLVLMPARGDAGWRFVSPMPHGRYCHGATLGPDGKIYVMGGMVFEVTERKMSYKKYDHGKYSNLVYDPQKDTWKYLEPVLGGIYYGRFYFFEPETGQWRCLRGVEGEKNYYDIDEGLKGGWRRYPKEIPPEKLRHTGFHRQGNGVAVVTGKDGMIYWLGGKGRSTGFGEAIVLSYDPVKSKWPAVRPERVYYKPTASRIKTIYQTEMPSMIDRRIDHEAVVTSDGKIYVMGGYQWDQHEGELGSMTGGSRVDVLDTVECYHPEKNKWEYRKPLTVKRMGFAAVVGSDDKIYVFGGAGGLSSEPSTPILDTTEVYDPEADTWSYRSPMPAPRKCHDAALGSNGKIYVVGGSGVVDGPPLSDVFIYDPAKDTWEKGPQMNLPRSVLAVVATPDGKIYAIGGTDVGAYEKSDKIHLWLPEKVEMYTGKVQDTVEVLDIRGM